MDLALVAFGLFSPDIFSCRNEGTMNLVFMFLDVWSGLSYFLLARSSSFEMALLSESSRWLILRALL
jgi:hypothetical protein